MNAFDILILGLAVWFWLVVVFAVVGVAILYLQERRGGK